MTEKEKCKRLGLKQACTYWKTPGYSKLSKIVAEIGYQEAAKQGIIPPTKKYGKRYLFRVTDILEWCLCTECKS